MSAPSHVLVVEDEEHLAIGIKYNLQAEGYHVTSVADGPGALRCFENPEAPIDLVILDVMLPGMSGYAVCETIRDRGSPVPILLLTARTLPEDRARGFDSGANQYLTKPFDLDELLSRVKNLLRHAQPAPKNNHWQADNLIFEFGEARINFDTHEVTVDGKPLRMTKLELDLLRYFVVNEGRVISRDELLEAVWNLPAQVNTRAPDQFIRRLRKAFEPQPSKPRFFLTVREAGYRFVSGQEQPAT